MVLIIFDACSRDGQERMLLTSSGCTPSTFTRSADHSPRLQTILITSLGGVPCRVQAFRKTFTIQPLALIPTFNVINNINTHLGAKFCP
ncbi:hypothetical protein AVEN_212082-1 [Araneus ventricosus]|uniref:Uncharacterized protein n=1 Tax=Araneus ventricosus TaxID=182803 RepID=A0A4Y2XCD3_ARAVE|nr:hypothetical protein AVEN_212082-1 [Araneus ventricosus]